MSESEKAATEKKLLAQVRGVPASDRDANLKIYQRLAELRPDKPLYKQKVDHYGRLARNPINERSLGGNGTVVNDPDTETLLVMCSGAILMQTTGADPHVVFDTGTRLLAGRLRISEVEARQRLRNLESQYGSWDAVGERCNQIVGGSSSP